MSQECKTYEALEQRLTEIRKRSREAAMSDVPLTKEEEERWLSLEFNALEALKSTFPI